MSTNKNVLRWMTLCGLVLAATVAWADQGIHLKAHNGQYMVAEEGGGGEVKADRDAAGEWETFTLIDLNGGRLVDGDRVHLRTSDGTHYLVAEDGGGREVKADRTEAGAWETFTIVKAGGSGEIMDGDAIALKADNGNYVVAEEGGGQEVNANREAIGEWETFSLELAGGAIRSSSIRVFPSSGIPAEVRKMSIAVSDASSIRQYLEYSARAATNTIDIGVRTNVYPAMHLEADLRIEKPAVIPLLNMYQNDQEHFSALFSSGGKSMICGPAAMANALLYLKCNHEPPYSRILEQSLPDDALNADMIPVLFKHCRTHREGGTVVTDLRTCAVGALKEGAYYDTGDVFIHGIHSSTKRMPPGPAALRFLGSVRGDRAASTIGSAAVLLFGWYSAKDPDNDGIFTYSRNSGHFVTLAGYDELEKDYMRADPEKEYTFYVSNPLVDYNELYPDSSIRYSRIALEAVPGRDMVRLPPGFKQHLYQAWQTRQLVGGKLAVLEDIVVVRP